MPDTTSALTLEPPIGAIVDDAYGGRWRHDPDGWRLNGDAWPATWDHVAWYQPHEPRPA